MSRMNRKIVGGHFKYPRGYAVAYDGQTTITYEWPCGHRRSHNYSKGHISKRISRAGCQMLASWHSKDRGGVNLGPCPTCKRKEKEK